jgi:hypothetical protein
VRVAKIDRDACLDRELKVPAHLDALVPGDRASELSRQALDGLAHGLFDVHARFPIGQVQEQRQARRPLDQRADSAATTGSEDEISLPVPRDRTVFYLGRSIADHHYVGDPPELWPGLAFAAGAPRPQAAGQLPTQFSTALDVKGLIDGLVAHAHLEVVGIVQN